MSKFISKRSRPPKPIDVLNSSRREGDLERRSRRLEIEMASSRTIALLVEQRDGAFRVAGGKRVTHKAFFRLHPPGRPDVFIANATDGAL